MVSWQFRVIKQIMHTVKRRLGDGFLLLIQESLSMML